MPICACPILWWTLCSSSVLAYLDVPMNHLGMVVTLVYFGANISSNNLQIEGLKRHPRYGARIESSTYKGMYHALTEIVVKEGFGGLYKGLFPSVVKSAPAGAVTFVAYEYISDWLESLLM